MLNTLKRFVNAIGLFYVNYICKREYHSQVFMEINERPVEFEFVFRYLALYRPRQVLDIGTGMTALPHLMRNCGCMVTAIDNISDYWPTGMINRHYHIINDDITKTKLNSGFDLITCVSVLEHVTEFNSAVVSMLSLLKTGGHLILTFPYNELEYCRNVYSLPDSSVTEQYPFITQAFSRKEIDVWVSSNNAEIVMQEYWQFYTGEFWTCGEMLDSPKQVDKKDLHDISCVLIRKT